MPSFEDVKRATTILDLWWCYAHLVDEPTLFKTQLRAGPATLKEVVFSRQPTEEEFKFLEETMPYDWLTSAYPKIYNRWYDDAPGDQAHFSYEEYVMMKFADQALEMYENRPEMTKLDVRKVFVDKFDRILKLYYLTPFQKQSARSQLIYRISSKLRYAKRSVAA